MSERLTIEIVLPGKSTLRTFSPVRCGRVARISKLMALAIKVDELVRSGVLRDYADLARLARISRPRATQLMNLLNLAPELQETLLFLPAMTTSRDWITERHLRSVVKLVGWQEQRDLFATLCPQLRSPECSKSIPDEAETPEK